MCRCSGDVPFLTADDFEKHLTELLEEIHANIPKVFINYILLFNISQVRRGEYCTIISVFNMDIFHVQVYDVSIKSEYCRNVHRVLGIECLCVFEPGKEGVHVR